jgi:Pyridoxal-dependent decarboxylase conserved domain
MAGEWLTATANTNMFTYEISPVFILMEHVTLKKMREIIGYKGGDSILAPGNKRLRFRVLINLRDKCVSICQVELSPICTPSWPPVTRNSRVSKSKDCSRCPARWSCSPLLT